MHLIVVCTTASLSSLHRYTYETFSHAKSVLKRDFSFIGEQLGVWRYPPYSDKKIKTIGMLLKNRATPRIPRALSYVLVMGLGVAVYIALKAVCRAADVVLPRWA